MQVFSSYPIDLHEYFVGIPQGPHLLLPLFVVGFFDRHVDVLEGRVGMQRLPLDHVADAYVLDCEGNEDDFTYRP